MPKNKNQLQLQSNWRAHSNPDNNINISIFPWWNTRGCWEMGTYWIYRDLKQRNPKRNNSGIKKQRWNNMLLKLAKGNTEDGHWEAKNLARQGATEELYDEPNLKIHPNFDLTGAQLAAMSQSLAYKGMCKQKKQKVRQGATCNLAITWHTVKEITGHFLDDWWMEIDKTPQLQQNILHLHMGVNTQYAQNRRLLDQHRQLWP